MDTDTFVENQVYRMKRECNSQILIMRQGFIFINTIEMGLVTYNTSRMESGSTIQVDKDSDDLQVVTGLPADNTVIALYTDRRENSLYIVSESKDRKMIHVSVRDLEKKQYVEISSFSVPTKSPILKTLYQQGGQIYTLDEVGRASVINIGSETINELAENCTEILVTSNGFFAR